MANIKIRDRVGIPFDILGLDLSYLFEGDNYTREPKKLVISYDSGDQVTFKGTGFDYDEDGTPIAGNVTSFGYVFGPNSFLLSGLKIKATDIVKVAQTETLSDDHRLLAKTLRGDDKFDGGSGNDTFNGMGGKDKIFGNKGKDTLAGGKDDDDLNGGGGSDTFVFDSALGKHNVDTISDFNMLETDKIGLGAAIFAEVGAALEKIEFKDLAKGKQDDNDLILYGKKGDLYYDHDGKGGDGPVKFAHLDHHPHLTAGDFIVI